MSQIEVPTRNYSPARRTPLRSFPSQVATALLQPVYFFRTLPEMAETRQWLWAALLIMALVAFSAIRVQELSGSGTGTSTPVIDGPIMDPGLVDGGGAPIDGGFGGPPSGGIPPVDGGGAVASTDVNRTWTTAVVTASGVLAQWLILAALLSLVTLFNGKAPRLGHNFQIAIWSSLPLAVMAALQLLYFSGGGTPGKTGVSGVLELWDGFMQQPLLIQSLLLSAASLLTMFWLWSLMMVYYGAAYALRGRRWVSVLVVVLWVTLLVVLPVVTGAVKPPEPSTEEAPVMEGGMPLDPSMIDPFASPEMGGDMPVIAPEVSPEAEPLRPDTAPEATREVKPREG